MSNDCMSASLTKESFLWKASEDNFLVAASRTDSEQSQTGQYISYKGGQYPGSLKARGETINRRHSFRPKDHGDIIANGNSGYYSDAPALRHHFKGKFAFQRMNSAPAEAEKSRYRTSSESKDAVLRIVNINGNSETNSSSGSNDDNANAPNKSVTVPKISGVRYSYDGGVFNPSSPRRYFYTVHPDWVSEQSTHDRYSLKDKAHAGVMLKRSASMQVKRSKSVPAPHNIINPVTWAYMHTAMNDDEHSAKAPREKRVSKTPQPERRITLQKPESGRPKWNKSPRLHPDAIREAGKRQQQQIKAQMNGAIKWEKSHKNRQMDEDKSSSKITKNTVIAETWL